MTALLHDLAAGTWQVDTAATSARFRARDVLRKPVDGTLPVLSAGVEVSPEGLPLHVWADLDLAGVATGSARRDRDLRGPRFFDVERGGVLRFTSAAARADDAGRWRLPGELALGANRCAVSVEVQVQSAEGDRVTVLAATMLDRRELGIRVPRLLVGPMVTVTVEAVLVAPTAARP
jgi:polyisoprenoid-binding protein YceI